ncbi:MAG: hypothetical protein H7Z72_10770 [Bacteroidetes bacterium]|nr:hypothetical protein [Fibrella sp.]
MTALEKEEMKELIRKIIREDKTFFRSLLHELVDEPVEGQTGREPDRAEKIDAIIRRDFERYKAVFKALA